MRKNCSGLAVQPGTGTVFCATNERDLLGDNLPPDYVTSIKPGAFYGWPWYYIGDHKDTRPGGGTRPDLQGKVTGRRLRAVGVIFPVSLLVLADEVIEE
jgi:glucose/arabinose dehydrogenase